MADLNFSKNVSDVRGTPNVPETQRKVSVETNSTPDFQSSFQAYAESNNNLGAIGASVAQRASNVMAEQLGYETGKNPVGDLSPPLTEFDQHFQETYHNQANATLSIQGQKLLEDANIEMAKSPRLNAGLITRTTQQLQLGLNKIAEQAPTAIKGKLQASFDSQVLQQSTRYQEKMFSEQREDNKNNLKNGIDVAIKNAYELSVSGDAKGADTALKSVMSMAQSGKNNAYFTPEEARLFKETAQQSRLDGHFINQANQAEKQGKLAEFEKSYAEKKLEGMSSMTNEQYVSTGQALMRQMQFINNLKAQDENLKSQQMINQIASDVKSITGTQWTEFQNSVSPLLAEQVKFKYIQAMKSKQASTLSADALIQNFSNPEAWANSPESVQNQAFNRSVEYTMQQSKAKGTPLTHDEAEVRVAASAGAKVPVFTNGLKDKLASGNPIFIQSAAQQIHSLEQMEAGHALTGLSAKDKAAYTKFEALSDSLPPTEAAREMTNLVYNQDPAIEQMNQQKWSNFLTKNTPGGIPPTTFALNSVGLKPTDFINTSMANVYGNEILNTYSSYYQILNGDNESALKLTKKFVDENYGNTGVNGSSFKTLHPLEKILGFKSHDAVPYIQQDVVDQMEKKIAPMKQLYVDKKTNEYWEFLPVSGKNNELLPILDKPDYEPIKIKRHLRTTKGEKVEEFPIVLQGNAFDWDVAIKTDSGMRNLFQFAPYLGIVNYQPNEKAIKERYNKDHNLKG